MAVKVIAHRGSNKEAPQNTLPAFRKAIEEKTNGFETDVHLTRDGQLVICHNYTIDDTSDGRGRISDFTLEELKKFDFGSYFSEDFKGTPLPTADEFLELVAPTDTDIINIEIKSPPDGSPEIVRQTLKTVKKHGVLDRVIISSFDPRVLKAAKELDPRVKTAFLYPTNRPSVCRPIVFPFLIARTTNVDIIHPAFLFVTKPVVAIAHKMGLQVNVWTVNDEKTVRFLVDCGVDGIITDCPGKVRTYIDRYERK